MATTRIEMLRALMKQNQIDAYLVPTADCHESEYVGEHFKCRHYISGFTGSAGTLVVTAEQAGLWTDGRYFVQAEQELLGSGVTLFRQGNPSIPSIEEFLFEALPLGGVLGFDGGVVNTALAQGIGDFLKTKKISFSYQKDLVGEVWNDRPARSCQPIWILETKYAGKNLAEKVAEIREEMKQRSVQVHILTDLNEIAWLLNLRGDDIPCNPLFLSYVVLTGDELLLFVQQEALTDEVTRYLTQNNVRVRAYHEILPYLSTLRGYHILMEKKKLSYAIYASLDSSNVLIDSPNPCALKKTVKNPTEIANMRTVHHKDAVAVIRFMRWLKDRISKEPLSEMEAVRTLEAFRATQEGYIEPSFKTIVAYRSNAAMCHYHPDDTQNAPLRQEGLLLVDSGGHYLDGTTDITRTYALGPLTDREKEYFTIVSSSMLKAGNMKFLRGCRGINLDYTIREALWQRGVDFNHGTGHGVGFVGGVHERPCGIRWKVVPEREDSAAWEPGMISSVEPGAYFENEFGVRTENLVLCVSDETTPFGEFLRLENLTYVPIDLDAIDPRWMDDQDIERLNAYHEQVYQRISPLLSPEEQVWLKQATRPIQK